MKKLETINLLTGIIVIILLGVAGAYLKNLVSQDTAAALVMKTQQGCDLAQQSCSAQLDGKTLSLDIKKPVKYLTKLEIELKVSGYQNEKITKVIIDFSMPGMEMGINRFEIRKIENDNVWHGMAILPVCISGRTDWQVKLYLQTDKAQYVAMHDLVIKN